MARLFLRSPILSFLAVLLNATGLAVAQTPAPDLVLQGDITGSQNQQFVDVPFTVPPGIHRISVDFGYTGKEQRNVLNLGIADPERFRGTSGGNKSHFTLSETDATPSYLPGAILPGTWRLLLSVPNIRQRTISHYRAEIRFNARIEDTGFAEQPLSTVKRWYRGDLHMHTGNSDGSCSSQAGQSVPCPVFLTVQTAASRGLDFIAITDHNAVSHYQAMRELQPYFDNILLIPGREMTTFKGHFNMYGITQFVPYDIAAGGRTLNDVLRTVKAQGGLASVNHAESAGGEECMGCSWEPPADIDMSLMSSVEVVNGGRLMQLSTHYWDAQLSNGARLAAIGGSDNHNATIPATDDGAIAWPTTGVEATELSVSGILDGIRAGRSYVDLTASHDKVIDFDADSGTSHARMGQNLTVSGISPVHISVSTIGCKGLLLHILLDGEEQAGTPAIQVEQGSTIHSATITPGPGKHWLRLELRSEAGELRVLSSPLYINFPN